MEPGPRRNWFERNWKWVVPTGCAAIVGAFAAFVGAVLVVAVTGMKHSRVYEEAVGRAKSSASVREALGEPIREGFFASGSVKVEPASGSAELAIPLSGPRGHGTLYVEATRAAGEWTFSRLVFAVEETGRRIDLLEGRRRLSRPGDRAQASPRSAAAAGDRPGGLPLGT